MTASSPLDATLVADTEALLRRAHDAAARIGPAPTAAKDHFLACVAERLDGGRAAIIAANQRDLEAAQAAGKNAAFIDRLRLDDRGIDALRASIAEIAALPDPVGVITSGGRRPNGLQVRRVRIPLGVIGVIYESRPNVTVDAAALCIKAGNAVVRRGGSDARHSNACLLEMLRCALTDADLPADAAQAPPTIAHAGIRALVSVAGGLDLVIPRGGTALIDSVNEHARVPVIQHYKGVCHLYVDGAADLDEAVSVVVNAKAQ